MYLEFKCNRNSMYQCIIYNLYLFWAWFYTQRK